MTEDSLSGSRSGRKLVGKERKRWEGKGRRKGEWRESKKEDEGRKEIKRNLMRAKVEKE